MWICLNDAFLSVVKDRHRVDGVVIRARVREHLALTFPHHEIVASRPADYAFRIFASKPELTMLLEQRVIGMTYPNFKASVGDTGLHDMYASFWSLHRSLQEDEA